MPSDRNVDSRPSESVGHETYMEVERIVTALQARRLLRGEPDEARRVVLDAIAPEVLEREAGPHEATDLGYFLSCAGVHPAAIRIVEWLQAEKRQAVRYREFVAKMQIELDDAADAVGPVPDLVERNLRIWSQEAAKLVDPTGGAHA